MGVANQNPGGVTGVATNYSNLSNFMSMNTSSSVQNSESHPSGTGERINHTSPNKPPGSNPTTAGITGVTGIGSQNPSIQGSAGGVSNNGRPSMTQTSHGKNFPYSMHRKTNSNKLPHIASSNGKDANGGNTAVG
jgi:hypothetical protein